MYLLKMAIEQAKSTEGPKIKAALENLSAKYEGVTGVYTKPFTTSEHEAIKEAGVVLGMVENGIVVKAK